MKASRLTYTQPSFCLRRQFSMYVQGEAATSVKVRKTAIKLNFEAQFPAKHDNYDKKHQITLFCKRNLQNIAFCYIF